MGTMLRNNVIINGKSLSLFMNIWQQGPYFLKFSLIHSPSKGKQFLHIHPLEKIPPFKTLNSCKGTICLPNKNRCIRLTNEIVMTKFYPPARFMETRCCTALTWPMAQGSTCRLWHWWLIKKQLFWFSLGTDTSYQHHTPHLTRCQCIKISHNVGCNVFKNTVTEKSSTNRFWNWYVTLHYITPTTEWCSG